VNERKLAQFTVVLLGASIFMFSVWLSTGYRKDKLPIYLGAVATILILWFAGTMLIRRNNRK
jgi:lipopolysaccharide export LptBFGC system permease protein LptF